MSGRSQLRSACTAFVLSLLAGAVASSQSIPLSKEWSQPHGNAAATAFVDVAPLKTPPTERWRSKGVQVVAGPVVSQAKLFVVVREGEARQLQVLDPASGAPIVKAALEGAGDVLALTVDDGLAAVFDAKSVHGWRLVGSELRPEKTVTGTFGGEPTQAGASLLASRGATGGVQSIEWSSGKAALAVAKSFGRPSSLQDDKFGDKTGRSLLTLSADDAAGKFTLSRFAVLSTASPLKLGPAELLFTGAMVAAPAEAPQSVLVAVKGKDGIEWYAWFGGENNGGLLRKAGIKTAEFRQPPASSNGRLYGFDQGATLTEIDVQNGGTNHWIEKQDLRKGAQIGAPSIARDVLYLGNWAVELGSKRVLWCVESLEADGPAIPAGDELLVVKTKDGALVGLGNGPLGGKPTTAAAGAKPALEPRDSLPFVLPGEKPGLIRADGVFIAGKVTALEKSGWRLEREGGKPQELAADDVALVDLDGKVKRTGEELALYRAFWRVLAVHHAEALVPVFEKWRDAKLYDECARVLEEAKTDGLAAARADELAATVAGKTSAKLGPTAAPRKKCLDFESAARVKSCDEVTEAAEWCADRDAKTAATVLLSRAIAISPKKPPDPELVKTWTPENLPTEALGDAPAKSWPDWAEALLPSGATFAVLDDSMRRKISLTKFSKDSLLLRTKNILLFTKEGDPALLGPLLARGETTMRALQRILGPSPVGLPADTPLQVRLFKTKADYLADNSGGGQIPVWSAGCFSPSENVSRFYSRQEGDEDDPLAHSLHEVFAHELTHHYVAQRWMSDRAHLAPEGFWMVEGFAEFVAGQALEVGRLGDAFDDATAVSIDRAAAADRVEMLLPLELLMTLDQKRFGKELEGGRFGPVRLHHSLTDQMFDKRLVFYAEATALTFFVMNRCGEKGRPTYRSWLATVYSGKALESPWKDLGFPDRAALNKAFREFLMGV